MGEKDKNIILSSSTLYINGESFTSIREGIVAVTEEPEDAPEIIRSASQAEFSASCQLCGSALEHVAEASRAAADSMRQFVELLADCLFDVCPSRVAHLARNGKKMRTRKKNWHRALRLVRKMEEGKSCFTF